MVVVNQDYFNIKACCIHKAILFYNEINLYSTFLLSIEKHKQISFHLLLTLAKVHKDY